MRIGVLTSSRADYGIYLPLLKLLRSDSRFTMSLIIFGTHLSKCHGFTIDEIIRDGFASDFKLSTLLTNDDDVSIATAFGLTSLKFADFWSHHKEEFDLIFCLGDRFEMAAAVLSGVPFNLRFGHIHGGETTLGAIDNVYRHAMTHASTYHFTSTEAYSQRVKELLGNKDAAVHTVGSLSLDNIDQNLPISREEFCDRFNIPRDRPYILSTIHPETVGYQYNEKHLSEVVGAFRELIEYANLVITMPNADTAGSLYRQGFADFQQQNPQRVILIENFGSTIYFAAMKHSALLLGNTSSGILEAASLNKYVINAGDRQKGRITGENVYHVPFERAKITETARHLLAKGSFTGPNPYKIGFAAELIRNVLIEQVNGK